MEMRKYMGMTIEPVSDGEGVFVRVPFSADIDWAEERCPKYSSIRAAERAIKGDSVTVSESRPSVVVAGRDFLHSVEPIEA